MALLLSGYPGVIWNAVRASLVYIQQNLNPSDVASMKPLATAFASTLQNGGAAISAYLFFSGTQANFAALSEAFVAPTRRPPFILRPRAEPLAPLICTEALAAALVAVAEAFAAFSESLVAPG